MDSMQIGNCTRYSFICIVIRRGLFTADTSVHTCINPYSPKQTYFINTHREITDGLQLTGHGRMETGMGEEEKRRWREKGMRKRRSGQGGEGRLESDMGRRVRGPYSFTHELSGGMRVRER